MYQYRCCIKVKRKVFHDIYLQVRFLQVSIFCRLSAKVPFFFKYSLRFSPDWKWDKFLLLTEYVSVQVLYESKKENDS